LEGWAVVDGAGVAGVDGGGGVAVVVDVVAAACVQAGVGGEDGVARIGLCTCCAGRTGEVVAVVAAAVVVVVVVD